MKILIGYDGSECADLALLDLQRAGLPENAEAHVLTVAEVWLPADDARSESELATLPKSVRNARERALREVEHAAKEAADAAERLRRSHPAWVVTSDSVAQSPAWGILNKASAWNADLVVVGSHGKSALGRFILGSISQKVLTESRCSVRIARGRPVAADEPIRLLVAFDGSDDAARAIDGLLERSWPAATEVTLVSVTDPVVASSRPPLSGGREWGDEAFASEIEWVSHAHKEQRSRLSSAGLIASSSILDGDPRRIIPSLADELNADCIFLGARGLNSIERFLIGSVSAAIASRAHCTVEVAR